MSQLVIATSTDYEPSCRQSGIGPSDGAFFFFGVITLARLHDAGASQSKKASPSAADFT